MKKIAFFAVLAVSVMLVFSCKSTPQDIEDAFNRVWNRYSNGIVMEGAQKYTVRSGDTLSRIANTQYGSGFYYPLVMLASSDIVQDPDKIQPGMELTIPDLQRNLSDVRARSYMRSAMLECADIEESRERASTAQGLKDLAATLTLIP